MSSTQTPSTLHTDIHPPHSVLTHIVYSRVHSILTSQYTHYNILTHIVHSRLHSILIVYSHYTIYLHYTQYTHSQVHSASCGRYGCHSRHARHLAVPETLAMTCSVVLVSVHQSGTGSRNGGREQNKITRKNWFPLETN